MNKKTLNNILMGVMWGIIILLLWAFFAGAEEMPPPVSPLAPTPLEAPPVTKCLETRFYKITLNKIVEIDQFGIIRVRQSYWLFETRYYIDRKFYTLINDGNYVLNDGSQELSYNKEEKLWYLRYKVGDQPICITAPFAREITTTWDWEVQQREYLEWFKKNYPKYEVPKVQTEPLKEPIMVAV